MKKQKKYFRFLVNELYNLDYDIVEIIGEIDTYVFERYGKGWKTDLTKEEIKELFIEEIERFINDAKKTLKTIKSDKLNN